MTKREAPRTPLPVQLHPPLALAPDPLTAADSGPQENNSQLRLGRREREKQRRKKGKGAVSLLSVSQPSLGSSCPSRQVKSQGRGGDIS
jgi:hypothetical protein